MKKPTNNFYDKKVHGVGIEGIEEFTIRGVNKKNVLSITKIKNEPEWIVEFRIKAFEKLTTISPPNWLIKEYEIDLDNTVVFNKMIEINQQQKKRIEEHFIKLGAYGKQLNKVSLEEIKRFNRLGVDLVLDSTSFKTSYHTELEQLGIVFCSISDAIKNYPNLIQKYLGSVVYDDNYFACLNSAFFSDGTFVYIPKDTIVPIDLSSYFRINSMFTSQFERTLIIAENGSSVNYLEGCSAPINKNSLLHCAVVEIVALDNSCVNYFTLQNWYSGDKDGKGGILNFVTKRGICNENAELNWVQLEVGSNITWKYPSCILKGDGSKGTFLSLSVTDNKMVADTGTKMIHLGKNTISTVHAKTVSYGSGTNVFRSIVKMGKNAENGYCQSKCDSYITGEKTYNCNLPTFISNNSNSSFTHEATIFKITEQQIFYLLIRGFSQLEIDKITMKIFTKDIINKLPDEFIAEADVLLELKFDENA